MLQIKILECLVIRGKQTKGMIEDLLKDKTHSDIINAFNKLESVGLIKKSGSKFGRGPRQYYYKATSKSLKLLVTINPHPLKFWKILLGYCHHYYDKEFPSEEIDIYFELFMESYLKYRNRSYSFLLDIFDSMRDRWFREMIQKSDGISVGQKIIEILAIHRGITFEQLVEKTRDRISDVSSCLSVYTLESYRPNIDKTVYIRQNVTGKRHSKKYWDFILHNIVAAKSNIGNTKVYELSLFGVMLALTLVRSYDMNRLNHGLYNDISFEDYYDKIASNYHNKIPLVFGKWKLLKDILRLYSAYNFDIIIDKELRTRDSDKFSVIRGGNKELFDSIREIVLQTRQQLEEFANAGWAVWLNYVSGVPFSYSGSENNTGDYLLTNNIEVQHQPDPQKVYEVKNKVDEFLLLLNPLELGFSGSVTISPDKIKGISNQLDKLFADEITAFYYFHLYFDYEFNTRASTPMKYFDSTSHNHDQFPLSSIPKECLSLVMKKDEEEPSLNEWFYAYMQDITNLQKEIYDVFRAES